MKGPVEGDNVSRNGPRFKELQCSISVELGGLILSPPIGVRDACQFVFMVVRELKEALENSVL